MSFPKTFCFVCLCFCIPLFSVSVSLRAAEIPGGGGAEALAKESVPSGDVARSAKADAFAIVKPEKASARESLAAQEIRRYVYLRTGALLDIVDSNGKLPAGDALIVVGQKDRAVIRDLAAHNGNAATTVTSLQAQQYYLKTLSRGERRILLVAGGDSIGTLYAAYRLAEHIGVRFYPHGDTIPDQRIELSIPQLDDLGKPLFEIRGAQAWHDFAEGPDWWNGDDYKALITQLAKMRMNYIGFHCYPEGPAGPEPTVWVGHPNDVNADGSVKFSSPSSYHNTARLGNWCYLPTETGKFSFGGATIFERDDYGPESMYGMMPWPSTEQENNQVFDNVGQMFREAFEHARSLGVKTSVGTEVPLVIPTSVKQRLMNMGKNPADPCVIEQLYEGIFKRIMQMYPVDFYTLWTPEWWTFLPVDKGWVDSVQSNILLAHKVAHELDAPFTLVPTGWVLGPPPPNDRTQFDRELPREMPFGAINRDVGQAPVDAQFVNIKGRPKWAMPWLEHDQCLTSPELRAGRMRGDAYDALQYGCTGLIGTHWRTRVLAMNFSALAQAGWNQDGWGEPGPKPVKEPKPISVVGGWFAYAPGAEIAGTDDDLLYQSGRHRVKKYTFALPDGLYTVKLQLVEAWYTEAGKRVFGVDMQGKEVVAKLDVFAEAGKLNAFDVSFHNIEVSDGRLTIEFKDVVEYCFISAISVEGRSIVRKVNCGGPAYKGYQADATPAYSFPSREERFLPVDDLYYDWALHEFGGNVAESIGRVFDDIDNNLKEPSTWMGASVACGPGGIDVNRRPWSQVRDWYAFVDELENIEPQIIGKGNRDRFGYWLNTMRYTRAMARVGCTLGEMEKVMALISSESKDARKKEIAETVALPLRKQLVQQWGRMATYLLSTVSNSGELGNVSNLEQNSMRYAQLLIRHDDELEKAMDRLLPSGTKPWKDYHGPDRIIVPAVESVLTKSEDLRIKVIILAKDQPNNAAMFWDAALYWRPLGHGQYGKISLEHIARGVYTVTVPAKESGTEDFEYYIKATPDRRRELYWPAQAPEMNQTVVVMQEE